MGRWGLVGFWGVRASGGWDGGKMGKGSNWVVEKESEKGEVNLEDGDGGFLAVKLIIRGFEA